MRSFIRAGAASLVAAFALSACGGGSVSGVSQSLPGTGSALPTNSVPSALMMRWNEGIVKKSQFVGPVSGDASMMINVSLQLRNERGLLNYAAAVSDPHSSLYRHFLTPQQIGQQYGASDSDIQSIAKYFHSFGIGVGTWPQHLAIVVRGKRSAMEKAFGTTFGTFRVGKQLFAAPVAGSTPHLQRALPIYSAQLASNVTLNRSYIIRMGAGEFAGYSPQRLGHGFDYSGAWGAGLTGTGITVGIVGTGPIDTSPTGDVPALQSAYGEIQQFGLPATGSTVKIVPAIAQTPSPQNGNTGTGVFDDPTGLATPPPVTAPCGTSSDMNSVMPTASCNPEDFEAQLDTESVAGLAPNAQVNFYLAFNKNDCAQLGSCSTGAIGMQGLFLSDDEIQQAIADNASDVLSLSYGLGEADAYQFYFDSTGAGPGPDEFAALAAEGIAVFASSGDNGNDSNCIDPNSGMFENILCASYPASDPSVVGVGGVNIPLDPLGKLTGQIAAWGNQTSNGGDGSFNNNIGSGGGVSAYFATPAFQQGVEPAANANPISPQLNGKRGVPDIALDADILTGPATMWNSSFGGGVAPSGGTSAAAPEAAAMWALVLQACKASASCATAGGSHPYRLGNPNPLFYGIYKSGMNGMSYGQVFYDVLYGQNQAVGNGSGDPSNPTPGPVITGCCTAGPGYDLVTGLGSPFAGHLIKAITGTNVP